MDDGNKTSIPITIDIKPSLGEVIIIVVNAILLSILAWEVMICFGHKHVNEKLIQAARVRKFEQEVTSPVQKLNAIARESGLMPVSLEEYIKNPATYDVITNLSIDLYLRDATTRQMALNEVIQIIGTILFGIGVSVIGLFNNSTITSLHSIGPQEVFVLLGIGLGIGSLKDFVDKFDFNSPAISILNAIPNLRNRII